jgi:hypothetical protein
VLPLVAKKVITAAMTSVSSKEAFPTTGLGLYLELPMVVASIPCLKVGQECLNSSLDGWQEAVVASIHLEAVAITSKPTLLHETLPTASWVLDPYENPVT